MIKYKLLLLLLLLIPVVYAADTDKALTWLSVQTKTSISSLSYSTLAIDALKPSDASALKSELNSRKSGENCWPMGACSIKDTSLALLALKQDPASNAWLTNMQKPDTEGKWILQIDTDSQGTCTITYSGKSAQITVNLGRISSVSCPTPSSLFDLNVCLEPGIISSKKEIDLSIICANLANPAISIAYNLGGLYIPIGEAARTLSTTIKIRNSYFLDFESTLYANWAFKATAQEPPSLTWLKKSYNPDNIIQNALLYILTEDRSYIQQLLTKQEDSGNFGSLFETALAVYALRKDNQEQAAISSAISWLDSQQSADGSWANSVEDTAAILFGAYAPISGTTTIIPSTTGPEEACKANSICEIEWGETAANCPADCSCGDSICDSSESSTSCSADCQPAVTAPVSECGDEVCDIDEDEETCPKDCKESHFFFWFMLLFFLALIVFLLYLYYTKFYKKGRSFTAELKNFLNKFKKHPKEPERRIIMPEAREVRRPVYQVSTTPRKTRLEAELEKSLEEAKKLLRK